MAKQIQRGQWVGLERRGVRHSGIITRIFADGSALVAYRATMYGPEQIVRADPIGGPIHGLPVYVAA